MYRRLIFDVDNTLFDFDAAEDQALTETLKFFGLPIPDDILTHYRSINRVLWQQLDAKKIDLTTLKRRRSQAVFDHIGQSVDHHAFATQYLDQLSLCQHLLPHVESTLESLSSDCDMAIITNGLSQVQKPRISQSTIGHHFDLCLISEDFGAAKPDPRIFHHCCQRMGWAADEQVLMVGDNYVCDVVGAKGSGLSACWFNLHHKKTDLTAHDHEIRCVSELPELLGLS